MPGHEQDQFPRHLYCLIYQRGRDCPPYRSARRTGQPDWNKPASDTEETPTASDRIDGRTAPGSDWHALDTTETLRRLASATEGLGTAEVGERIGRFGPNRRPAAAGRPAWKRFLTQFHNVLIYALIVAGAIAFGLGHELDAAVIGAVIVINALIGFVQEGRAEAAMAAIDRMLARSAEARRDGKWTEVPADSLVPGDIVRIGDGDRVPGDLRLLEVHGLRVDAERSRSRRSTAGWPRSTTAASRSRARPRP